MANIQRVTRYRFGDREWAYQELTQHLEDAIGQDIIDKVGGAVLSPAGRIAVHTAILANQTRLCGLLQLLQELRAAAHDDDRGIA